MIIVGFGTSASVEYCANRDLEIKAPVDIP